MPEPPQQPPSRATALHYEPGSASPQVTATGSGHVAQRILEVARDAGVPIRSDPALVQALSALDVGAAIPEALWLAVAEALAWAYRLDAKARRPGT